MPVTTKNPRQIEQILSAGLSSNFLTDEQLQAAYDEHTLNQMADQKVERISLIEAIHEVAATLGVRVPAGRIDDESLSEIGRKTIYASSTSSVSLPGILGDSMNKQLLAVWKTINTVYEKICRISSRDDFKEASAYRVTETGGFQEVGPGGEIKHGRLSESEYLQAPVETKGQMLVISRRMIRNDDVGAFGQIPAIMARNGKIAIEEQVVGKLMTNPTMSDGHKFFSVEHGNLLEGADSELGIESLSAMETLFGEQVDAGGKPILIDPDRILVRNADFSTANALHTSDQIRSNVADKEYGTDNVHKGIYRPYRSPYLTNEAIGDPSFKGWFMFCNPNDVAALCLSFLDGRQTPIIEMADMPFTHLGIQFRGYFDFVVDYEDWRGAAMSTGKIFAE